MDNRTERAADGAWRVEVGYYVNAYVLADNGTDDTDGLTLVDSGWRTGGPRLVRSVRMLGFDPRAVHRVLLTHWHPDHAGSAARFVRSSAAPTVHVGSGDLGMVTGAQAHPLAQPDAQTTRLGRLAVRRWPRPEQVPGALPLEDGDRLDVCGGLEVIASPGHTPGHTAFWAPGTGLLIVGDALFDVFVAWRGPRALCTALPRVQASLGRLDALGAGVVAPGHGPLSDGRRLGRVARRRR